MGNSFSPGSRDVCLVAAVVVCGVPNILSINTMLSPSFVLLCCFIEMFYPQQVVMDCTGSGVGVRLSDHGWSGLCHPGDCLLGLKSHEVKSKQCGKFVLPG